MSHSYLALLFTERYLLLVYCTCSLGTSHRGAVDDMVNGRCIPVDAENI
jgi:hypothetical protein